MMMAWLRIKQKCSAAGRHLAVGEVLAVPGELPIAVASALARMGRAEALDAPPDPPVAPPVSAPRRRKSTEPDAG